MVSSSGRVNLKPIDPDKLKIEKSALLPGAYVFDLELDSTPDHHWILAFEAERQASRYMHARTPVAVVGNKLEVATLPDEIKGKVEWIKGLVDSTNKSIEKYNEQIKQRHEAEQQKQLKEQETIKRMREALKK
ncbi:MAG: hypothetical protein O2U62_07470 [Candidatus Bathyarchaeota archaeon]|nr:hypothetical protein [Candidatus Bathyarchaeota archaeon]